MNRILFESDEIREGFAAFGGDRAEHVLKVLHGEVGQVLKTGEIGGMIGTSTITAINGGEITVQVAHTASPLASWCDLILAPPRPRVMKRLLPQLATLGVGTVILVGAKKVEKDFWGATLLKAANYRPLFVDGLMQGGVATELPRLEMRRNLRKFLNEELDALFPQSRRILAHPYTEVETSPSVVRPLFAIGPEGGWTDEEVALFKQHGFAGYSLGRRILRTDTATIALLSCFANER